MRKPCAFEAIIFDHDGTLIDTESMDCLSCQMLFAENGITLTQAHWAEYVVGRIGGYEIIFDQLIEQHNSDLNHDRLWARLRELWQQNLKQVTLMPHIDRFLPDLYQAGYPLAVATASDRKWANRWLGQFQLQNYFQVIATRDDVEQTKPAPDVYLYAAEQLGVTPSRCLVFEDSLAGVQSAKSAGMTVVAVPSPVTQSLDFSLADVTVVSLADVDRAWITRFGDKILGSL